VSSEAAQKAYPEPDVYVTVGYQMEQQARREAFDRGAVEALRRAAERIADDGMYESHYEGGGWVTDVLERMADEWERGSA